MEQLCILFLKLFSILWGIVIIISIPGIITHKRSFNLYYNDIFKITFFIICVISWFV